MLLITVITQHAVRCFSQPTAAGFIQPGSRTIKVHAKWVFFDAGSTALYVVVQADQSSGLLNDFSVQTISLAPADACGALFNVSSAEVVADGEIGTVRISAASSCGYEAVSTSPWIQII